MLLKAAARAVWVGTLVFGLCWTSAVSAETLRIDGFESGDTVVLQLGFAQSDIAAVRLEPQTLNCPCKITAVQFILNNFSQTSVQANFFLHVWDDPGAGEDPGTELFVGTIQPSSSQDMLNQIDVSDQDIIVNGPFRVGLEYFQTVDFTAPTVVRDADGTITAEQNTIFDAAQVSWIYAEDAGLVGDFVIRAIIEEAPTPSVPSLSDFGVIGLCTLLLAMAGFMIHRRSSREGDAFGL